MIHAFMLFSPHKSNASTIQATCGNGKCDSGESLSSCPRDCAPSIASPTYRNKKFIFFGMQFARTWFQAREFCAGFGGDLASIWDAQEYTVLKQFNQRQNTETHLNAYAGLNDIGAEGVHEWSDGSKFNVAAITWGPTQPDNYLGSQDCSRLYIYEMDDIDCTLTIPFLCATCWDGQIPMINCYNSVSKFVGL